MAWIMGDTLTNTDFISLPDTPFQGDSPYTMWRINPNANEGMPYVPLMIGVPVLEPPVTTPNIYFGNIKVVAVYYGTQAVSSVYFGNHKI